MSEEIRLPTSGLYVAFAPNPDRVARGARYSVCNRCSTIVGHWPQDSAGHEIICLACANEIPAIRQHIDELAKARE